jgi:hypothetical protein
MKNRLVQATLAIMFATMAMSCGGSDDGGGSTGGAQAAGGAGGAGGQVTGGAGGRGGAGGSGAASGAGVGVKAMGSYNGTPVSISCAPPSNLRVGTQFAFNAPFPALQLWSFRCRTADQKIQIWFEVNLPEAGKTYEQPSAGDKFNINLGDPLDAMGPPGRMSTNRTKMTLTIMSVDVATKHLAGSFSAAWMDDGKGKYGQIDGTFSVTGWGD